MRAIALATYTTAGAAAGALFTGLGATICHAGAPDRFNRTQAALAGLIGGAATHGALGLLAAFDHDAAHDRRLQHIGASLPLAALTSGVLGGAILGLCGYQHPDPGALVLSGVLGAAVVTAAAALATCVSVLTCAPRPGWTMAATGDLGQGESLLEPESAPVAASEHPHRSLAERLIPWERRQDSPA